MDKQIKVLDKGFVRLVDYMGDDNSIVQAARVSYGDGTKTKREDRGLIRYLLRNEHSSPFEMVEFKFHMKMPLFVARQLVRHRTACISWDSELYFDLPNAIKKGKRCLYKMSMEEFYNKWNKNNSLKRRLQSMNLRHCNENTGEIDYTHVKNVFKSGIKSVYEIELEDGKKIKTTLDHLYYSDKGWGRLEDLVDIRVKSDKTISSWVNKARLAINGSTPWQQSDILSKCVYVNRMADDEIGEKLGCSQHTIRKWREKLDIHRTPEMAHKISARKQRGRRRNSWGNHTDKTKKMLSVMRSGKNSNFWKGGICERTKDDIDYDNKWRNVRNKTLKLNNYTCCVTNRKSKLEIHHIIPRWENENLIFDENNLVCINKEIHKKIHSLNLEKKFEELFRKGEAYKIINFINENISEENIEKKFFLHNKLKGRMSGNKLIYHDFKEVKSIRYVGEEMTYDIEVDEKEFHNFVCNGFIVHNSMNEVSGRYSILTNEAYVPDLENIKEQSSNNKQGRGESLNKGLAESIKENFVLEQDNAFENYNNYILDNVARELARINLPLATYTEMYWKMDLRNLLHFLKLRLDSHAQYEIRVYAQAIFILLNDIVPLTMEAFSDYVLFAKTFSKQEVEVLREIIKDYNKGTVVSKEISDIMEKINGT